MVKSYNRKGFGFIMCESLDVDVYFSRDSLAPQLQTSDLAGEYVTFEVFRFPDGKMQARNLRPVGETGISRGPDGFGGMARGKGCLGKGLLPTSMLPGGREQEEDRSRDWYCEGCGERNFTKRFECFKCRAQRPREDGVPASFAPPPPRRTLSPHAGSRAMREMFRAKGAGKGASRSPAGQRKRRQSSSRGGRRPPSDSSGSSSSSSRTKKRRVAKRKKHRSTSRSGSSDSSGSVAASSSASAGGSAPEPSSAAALNPEVEKAKAEVLAKLLKLKEIDPRDSRIREWRALLREWHPDKNPDRTEVATAVFQFLQKGKALIDP